MELSTYDFSTLRGGTLTLSRGRADGRAPILLVAPVGDYPARESLARLEHEFSLRTDLDPDFAARPVQLVRRDQRQVLVLEDRGGEPLEGVLGRPLDVATFLRIAIPLAAAVGRMHARGLVHKDLKPSNILADGATGRVWLTGFGIASRLPREHQPPAPPEVIAGTLAYMAPEQTGRMNRSIDSRSDLYALGVTFYEMLTGALPFACADPMEWIHCHIARQPVPPVQRNAAVPAPLSAIVVKLLAKTAEDRYQTAAGLVADLRRCADEWEAVGRVDPFPLGTQDTSDRLLIPERLYGREAEIDTLVAAFDRVVADGAVELVLVSGYSGIGKSSVVNELHQVLVPPRGMFAAGKFDQYKRDIPYATLVQAFQGLVRPLLAKSDAELALWRDALVEALTPNARLMTDLIPELRLIIGEQPPVPALEPQQAQHRFHSVLRRFISVFARPEHPLALFLDDLQWLDAATLDLLEDLLTRGDLHHLMLIGAYRDNEVDAGHPLRRKLDAIREGGGRIHDLALAPLARGHVERLLADTLHCEPEHAAPLAQLVYEKTGGNPFFVMQFLSSLFDEGLLRFDHAVARWSWNLERIHAERYTDNVVDLMVGKLTRLPAETQRALPQLACLGNVAEDANLAIVLQMSEERVHAALWPAVRQQLIERQEGRYRFVHDRVHEAAYSLIPAAQRAEVHLRIGRLLVARTPAEKRGEAVFEIVNQLNRGAELMTAREERERLAEYNLSAALRAKSSVAYASALSYLTAGGQLLGDDAWERRHELWFALEMNRAECEFLTGQLAAAEQRLLVLWERAGTAVERAEVAGLQLQVYTFLDQNGRAVECCLDYLRRVGIAWTAAPTDDEVRAEYERIWTTLGGRTIEELIDLPLMTDPASLATAEVLSKLFSTAAFTAPNLASLTICKAISLSLERGICDASCLSYVLLGRIAGPRFDDYQAGWRFGQLGYQFVERRGLKRFEASTFLCFAIYGVGRMRHIRTACELVGRAFDAANRSGDLTYGAYTRNILTSDLLFAGESLPTVQREAEHGIEYAAKACFPFVVEQLTTHLALVRMLRGATPKFGSFDDAQLDEREREQRLEANPALGIVAGHHWIRKLQARYLAGDYAAAVGAAANARRTLWTSLSLIEEGEYHFYSGLAHAAHCDALPANERAACIDVVRSHHAQLQRWAEVGPENYEHRAALMRAELARLSGDDADAMRGYELAKRSAREHGFVHNEALAYELASRFHAARGFDDIAQLYRRKARYCYQQWGADGKVRQLDEIHPELREAPAAGGPRSTIDSSVERLDLATVLRISHAVSSEIVLEQLTNVLLRTAVEHAGAERGLLILVADGEFEVQAEARISGGAVRVELGELSDVDYPQAVVQYAARTRAPVILDDASAQAPLSADDYVRRHHARSILCLPLVKHGKLVALLYLENHLTPRAFTADRVAVLELVASQAAISLENARLYSDLRRSEAMLSEAQHLSETGSFLWRVATDEIVWSEQNHRIFELDPSVPVTLDAIASRMHEDDLAVMTEMVERGRADEGNLDYEFRVRVADGSVKYLHVRAHATRDEDGSLEYVGAIQDVSRQRRSDDAISKLRSELTHVARVTSLGVLTASIAHEVNQPLAALLANAGTCLRMLAADPPDVPAAIDRTQRVVRSGQRASEVIARLRALFAKDGAPTDRVDLNEATREVVALSSSELQRSRVLVRTELADDLPAVLGDRVQLQQVILNLILNARDAMDGVESRPRVLLIRTDRDGDDGVSLSVQDSGVGLDAETQEKLFEAFYTTKPNGMGIGLSVSRSIIERHGGRLRAVPNDGPGATFSFTIPRDAEATAVAAPPDAALASVAGDAPRDARLA